jgi:hypothetical protein
MYAWCFPKDQTLNGISTGAHRHDWENIALWFNSPAVANPQLLGGVASGHGSYKKTTNPQKQGDRVKVEYYAQFTTNHGLQFTNTLGRDYPLIDWDVMSQKARDAFENTDFGSASCPFRNGNFGNNLNKAML